MFNKQRQFLSAQNAKRKAIRAARVLPPGQQALAAVYALGIRDGLQIAADIHEKVHHTKGE